MAADPKPEDVQKQMEQMRDWLDKQPHFPKNLDDKLIRRFLHSCYYDLEQAKTAAGLFFNIRASLSDVFSNRDPQSPDIQKTFKITNLAQLRISGNRNLLIWQLNDPGLENYDYIQDARVFGLVTDAFFLDDDSMLKDYEVVIMDVKDITLKFITKFNVSLSKKITRYQEGAMPIRLKQIHVVNAPQFIDKIFSLMKPFLKQEIINRVHFHVPKSNTLHEFLSKDDLPEDYGGTNGRMEDHMESTLKLINSLRTTLLKENLWMADKKSKSKLDVTGAAFRTLAID